MKNIMLTCAAVVALAAPAFAQSNNSKIRDGVLTLRASDVRRPPTTRFSNGIEHQ